jgi:hypothetical protein
MTHQKLLFGQIAVEKGFCVQEDVQSAVDVLISRAVRGDNVNLGAVMVEMGLITKTQVEDVVTAQQLKRIKKEDTTFGKLAIYHEFCTEEDVEFARNLQEDYARRGKPVPRIGEVLVKFGRVKPQERDAIISMQFRIKDPDYWSTFERDFRAKKSQQMEA